MFRNEPTLDFAVASNRERIELALSQLDQRIKQGELRAAPIINGQAAASANSITRLDPNDGQSILGKISLGDLKTADAAITSVQSGFEQWSHVAPAQRAKIIAAIGDMIAKERDYLTALVIREAGKPWAEADGDVVEAVDFCRYYADQSALYAAPKKTMDILGEDNWYLHRPRGIAAVIPPWNFPLAIACGMTVAALVTGNTVILKPAEQTSLIAAELVRIAYAAGVPANALAFLPGIGEEVGRAIVRDQRVALICFTGSKGVGMEIISTCANPPPGARAFKKVIAEMGGKNTVIIDEDADLDEAVRGILYSAFGYAGQKCSACSRVIAVGDAYQPFLDRLCAAAADVSIGPSDDPSTYMGPVIDAESQRRLLKLIAESENQATLAFKGAVPATGFYVPITIFRDVAISSNLWREEAFGPVLACRQTATFVEALELANDSQYALTGGVFSRSPANLALAKDRFEVGNLYLNRGVTGSIVGRQPFGGFRLSGVGDKAGGPEYLSQFVEQRVVTENTIRRGFAPELG